MGILSMLAKGVQAMIDDANTPESFKIGEKFEGYVREFLFLSRHYDLLERTHNYTTNKDYVISSLNPDFKFRDRDTKREFYVEAKFRSALYNGKIVWCNESQLKRYSDINKNTPVFLILGFGEDPGYPDGVYLLPLSQAKCTGLFPSHVEKFQILPDQLITSKTLWLKH